LYSYFLVCVSFLLLFFFFFFQAEDGIRDFHVTGVQTCALPIWIARQDVEVRRGEISQAQAQVQQATAGGALVTQRAQELAVAEARAADAAAAVEVATVNRDRTSIRAPEDGWVTNRTVQIGQVIQPNQPLLSLALANHVWVIAN